MFSMYNLRKEKTNDLQLYLLIYDISEYDGKISLDLHVRGIVYSERGKEHAEDRLR
jgi:hypothetical protein